MSLTGPKTHCLQRNSPPFFGDIRATSRFFFDVDFYDDRPGPYKGYNFRCIWYLEKSDCASCPDAYSRPEASWRRMLVTQPAVKLLKIVHANLFRKRWRKHLERKDFPSKVGLQMDFLYDFVVDEVDGSFNLASNGICSTWRMI